jgi:hypothetical protein
VRMEISLFLWKICFWGFGLFLFLFTDMLSDQKSL